MSGRAPIQVWFEFGSTYSYLALHEIQRVDAPFSYQPFLLGPIFAAQGWKDSPFNIYPAKGRYMWRDMERLCEAAALPFRKPSTFPRNGLTAARIAIAQREAPWLPEFVRRVYRANFAEDREISAPSVLGEILRELGLDAASLLEQAEAPATKQALKAQTARAVELGIFGAPTFVVQGELFWGGDRLQQAVAYWEKSHAAAL